MNTHSSSEKLCILCASSIPISARKCVHCSSFQDWRRFIEIGNTSLALLIAFVTVLGALISTIYSSYSYITINEYKPKFSISVRAITDRTIQILYSNLGQKSFFIDDGILCRIPITHDDSEYIKKDKLLRERYPKGNEVKSLHMLVYTSDISIQPLEAGASTIVEYKIHQKRPEKGTPFKTKSDKVMGYCSAHVIDILGKMHGNFIPVSEFDVHSLQIPLKTSPYFGYPKTFDIEKDDQTETQKTLQ